MAWTIFDKLAVIGTIIAVLGFLINLWYTWKSTKSPQPQIRISRVTTRDPWVERENLKPVISLLILIRNTGERSTFLSLNMQLMVLTNQKRNFRSVKTLFETEMQAEQNLPKAYNFEMHRDAFDWWFSSISIKGYYLNTKDKKRKIRFNAGNERKRTEWRKPKRVRWYHSISMWITLGFLKLKKILKSE